LNNLLQKEPEETLFPLTFPLYYSPENSKDFL